MTHTFADVLAAFCCAAVAMDWFNSSCCQFIAIRSFSSRVVRVARYEYESSQHYPLCGVQVV